MHGAALAALLSHWRRHPLQLAMLLAGLALATALWTGVQAINAEARASYDRAAALLGQDSLVQLVPERGQTLPEGVFADLRRAGWRVSPVLEGRLEAGGQRLRIIGIEPLTAPPAAQPLPIGTTGIEGFLAPEGLGFAPPATIAALGDAAPLPLNSAPDLAERTIIADIGAAQRLLGQEGRISRLVLWPGGEGGRPLSEIAPGVIAQQPQPGGEVARLTDSFHLNLTAFGFLSFAVGLFIVHAAIGLAFEQRRPTLRTLRALGLPARTLATVLLAELLVLALLAGAGGVALGYGGAAALLPDVAATLRGLYGAEVAGALSLRPGWAAAGLAMAMLGALAAAGTSLWRSARMPILAPARPRAWAMASDGTARAQAALGLVLLLAAFGLALWGQGLVAGFALLAALLLGAALVLPLGLSLVLAGLARAAGGPLAQWFWADARQQVPGLSLALMALMLALSANVGVGTMVGSFRAAFTIWLDQRLASEIYVTARSEAEAEDLRAFLAPRVDAVLPIWSVPARIAGERADIYGVIDHATYRLSWPMLEGLPGVWDRLDAGEGGLISEQMARRAALRPGDTLRLPGGWEGLVLGVYADYGNPDGQVVIANDLLLALYPDVPRLRHALRVPPERIGPVMAELAGEFGLPEGAMIDQTAVKRFSLEVFERTFAVTAALNVLTLGVAGLALLASLVTLSGLRLAQVAPVWAMGVTRARLAWMELARAVMLAALTAVLALPAGLALAWVLLAVVNVEAFGWRLPMLFFPWEWARLLALALVAAALAAALPARALARRPPAEMVKLFAQER
ncbi:MAG: FtsX-like permease family protein [Rhodobacteraceae bacterium]|nr:FtsX-like permease family protein [Paracoccaceae bacterium]